MKVKAYQLDKTLGEPHQTNCYIVSGDDLFQREWACHKIRTFVSGHGFKERIIHYGDAQFDWSTLEHSLAHLSLFSQKQLIELRLETALNTLPSRTQKLLVSFTKTKTVHHILLISCAKISKAIEKSNFFQQLSISGMWIPVWPFDKKQLTQWIIHQVRGMELRITPEATTLLVAKVEGNTFAAQQSLEKLFLTLPENKKNITLQHVIQTISENAHYDIFKITDAMISGDARLAVHIYKKLLHSGIEINQILWVVIRELRILVSISDLLQQNNDIHAALKKTASDYNVPLFSLQRKQDLYLTSIQKIAHKMDIYSLLIQAQQIDILLKNNREKHAQMNLISLIITITTQKNTPFLFS